MIRRSASPVARVLARVLARTRTRTRITPWSLALGGGCLAAMSIGAPSGCLDVLSTDEAAPPPGTPTSTTVGTQANPEIVSRDNLAFGGSLTLDNPNVTATLGKSEALTDGRWTNLTGHEVIREYRAQGTHYLDQY